MENIYLREFGVRIESVRRT